MDVRRYKDLIAVKFAPERIWGFHAHNLDVAALTTDLWAAIENAATLTQHPVILEELNNWNNEVSRETQDADNQSELSAYTIKKLSLNIAQVCNLSCTYCAAGGDGTYGSKVRKADLTKAKAQIRHFLLNLSDRSMATNNKEENTFHLQYIGGEPLLYPSVIRELSQYAVLCSAGTNCDVAFSITTNGTLITEKIALMLAEFNFSVAVSIDGDEKANDLARPAKSSTQNSTAMTLNGLKEIKKVSARLRALKANSVFGSHNIDISRTYKFLSSLEIAWTEFNFIYANNEKDEEFSPLYISEMMLVAKQAYQVGGLTELAKIKQFAYVLSRLAAKTRIHSYCGAGKTLIQSDTKGDLYTCNWFMNEPTEKVGSLTTLDKNKLSAYKKSLIELNKCESCWARHLCGGGCMAVHKAKTGSRHSKDPHFCARTRAIAATAIHYYAESLETN